MEDILDVYQRPYDPKVPVVCMDEQPRQLIKEIRKPLSMIPGVSLRYDWEYERAGTAVTFLFTEPLAAWRKVRVRARKTRIDWAMEIKALLDVDYPDAEVVILVCDQPNIHSIASLYEAFAPEEARRLSKRLEMHHTPKHGSWLNIAEIELSALSRQALDHRIPDMATLHTKQGPGKRSATRARNPSIGSLPLTMHELDSNVYTHKFKCNELIDAPDSCLIRVS